MNGILFSQNFHFENKSFKKKESIFAYPFPSPHAEHNTLTWFLPDLVTT